MAGSGGSPTSAPPQGGSCVGNGRTDGHAKCPTAARSQLLERGVFYIKRGFSIQKSKSGFGTPVVQRSGRGKVQPLGSRRPALCCRVGEL